MLIKSVMLLSALAALGICALAGGFGGLGWLWMLPLGFVGTFLLCALVLFLMVWIPSKVVDTTKVQEDDDPFFRWVATYYAPAVFTLLRTKINVTGQDIVPKSGRFMVVCNHIDNLDSGVLLAVLNKSQLAFLAKKETRDMFLIGPLMPKILCQFLDRENDRAALKTILRCIEIVKEDKVSLAAFPEGGVIEDGKALHHFRNGVFKIAQRANVPIVVCTIRGTEDILDNFKHFKKSVVDLRFLDVVPAADIKGVHTTQIGRRVYNIMAPDLGVEPMAEV